MASCTTEPGSAPSLARTISEPVRVAHCSSWSAAAARKVSPAASSTRRPSSCWRLASLPIVVVLPTPLTPTNEPHRDAALARPRVVTERSPLKEVEQDGPQRGRPRRRARR